MRDVWRVWLLELRVHECLCAPPLTNAARCRGGVGRCVASLLSLSGGVIEAGRLTCRPEGEGRREKTRRWRVYGNTWNIEVERRRDEKRWDQMKGEASIG